MTHVKKVLAPYYQAMVDGLKPFEACLDDRDPPYAVGDKLIIQEVAYTPGSGARYTGRCHKMGSITYILRDYQFGIKEGYCVLGFGAAPRRNKTQKQLKNMRGINNEQAQKHFKKNARRKNSAYER